MTAAALALLLSFSCAAASAGDTMRHGVPVPSAPPEIPEAAPAAGEGRAGNFEETRDRILYSLFFRGEVADKIIEAGLAGRFVETAEGEPYSELRERMLAWIKSEPDEAARVYLRLGSGAAAVPGAPPDDKEYSFEISPHFIGLVKALAAAGGDPRASDEDLGAAGRRLFAGLDIEPDGSGRHLPQSVPGALRRAGSYGGTMRAGPAENGPADDGSSLINADFRLDKKALTASARNLGAWTDSARRDLEQARGPRAGRRTGLVEKAFSDYRGLLGAASSVSGRERITAAEAARLEKLRSSVRSGLSASSLLAGADDLDAMADVIERRGRPASARRARAAAAGLDDAGARIESGSASAVEISRLVREGERLYLAASFGARAALLLANMAERASRPDFSCLYDFLADRYFRRAAPSSAYARSRLLLSELGRAAPAAAGLAEEGDFEGAFAALAVASGPGGGPEAAASEFGNALRMSVAVSRANARAQYFFAGALLNPLGLEFGPAGFRLSGLFPGSR
ncbi:MAG: hypothetical protein FD189_1864 [Elusimicrobia bacterium]|nr:MAG: hypothetical protein FD154_2041 [Elusimicrobiota bacterium]KAF0154486.1 MAG: hypothetical protein FD189_1864 [Elusimicrobiota bacterium]